LPATQPAQAGAQYGRWLDELQARQQGQRAPRHYASLQAVAARLIKNNPRLSLDKAHWLAAHWAREQAPGQWAIRGEAGHRVASAQLYRVDESLAVFAQIAAPCLMVEAAEDSIAAWWAGKFSRAEHLQRLQSVPQLTRVTLPDCGHMLHHDQPQALAALLQRFLWQA